MHLKHMLQVVYCPLKMLNKLNSNKLMRWKRTLINNLFLIDGSENDSMSDAFTIRRTVKPHTLNATVVVIHSFNAFFSLFLRFLMKTNILRMK